MCAASGDNFLSYVHKMLHKKVQQMFKCSEQWLRVCLKCSPCHPLCEGLPTVLWLPWGKHDICLRKYFLFVYLGSFIFPHISKHCNNLQHLKPKEYQRETKLVPLKIEAESICAFFSSSENWFNITHSPPSILYIYEFLYLYEKQQFTQSISSGWIWSRLR